MSTARASSYQRPLAPVWLFPFLVQHRIVSDYVQHYKEIRLHSAIGYVTPQAKLEGREREIFAARDRKLEARRAERREKRLATQQVVARMSRINC